MSVSVGGIDSWCISAAACNLDLLVCDITLSCRWLTTSQWSREHWSCQQPSLDSVVLLYIALCVVWVGLRT